MIRFLPVLMGLTLVIASTTPSQSQEKQKEPPKKRERIAISEIDKAKLDPDFGIQGEYVGEITLNEGKSKIAAQVIAKGLGEFDVKVLMGGLPGDGWNKVVVKGMAKRGEDGKVTMTAKEMSGTIADGKMTIKDGMKIDSTLTQVHRVSSTLGAKPIAGAEVLFAGPGDETKWTGGKIVTLSDGKFLNMGITSKQAFQNFHAHVEFRLPWMPNSSGQGRGNSGVYLQNRYELQVLDSFGLNGENNECGGIYTLHKPSVNMCYPPLTWQTYDIDFTAALYDAEGKKTAPARITVVHNGVKIQDNVELKGPTGGGQEEKPTPGPFQLQNHGDPLVYNNIWVVEKK